MPAEPLPTTIPVGASRSLLRCWGKVDIRTGRWRVLLASLALGAAGCGHAAPTGAAADLRQQVLSYDDNHATAGLAFPSLTYETLVRFELPAGKQQLARVWLAAEAVGTVAITVYPNTLFESPGDPLVTVTRELVAADLSTGKDGRWVGEDLSNVDRIEGVVWIGVRKIAGAPTLWTSAIVSGQTYLRDRDPSHGINLLPVKRTPMLRLELAVPQPPRPSAAANGNVSPRW